MRRAVLSLALLAILSLAAGGCKSAPKSSNSFSSGEGSNIRYFDEPVTAGGPMDDQNYR